MPGASNRPIPPELIVVIDASILIHFKGAVKLDAQWAYLTCMTRLVEEGRIALVRQVVKELSVAKHPDAPGAWVAGVRTKGRYPQPTDDALVEVLDVAERLVEVDADPTREVADPYIAAMALELSDRYPDTQVVVATDDNVDRLPAKLSLATACDRLHIDHWPLQDFLEWVGSQMVEDDV